MKIIGIYDYLHRHRLLRTLSLLLITFLLVFLLFRQNYKEDISDFLPLDKKYQKAMDVFQHISDADRVVVVFSSDVEQDPDSMVACINDFCQTLEKRDTMGLTTGMVTQLDMEDMTEVSDFVYANIPYFLSSADYERIDSLLSDSGYVRRCLAEDKEKLMLPMSGAMNTNVSKDPLDLFSPVLADLSHNRPSPRFETYDGYIFSEDMAKAFVMITSPYGASETGQNAEMLANLRSVADETMGHHGGVEISFAGGPVIAVSNSTQIKTDSVIAILIAVMLIVALMFVVFRRFRDILLIVVSIAWGWLFAMGGLWIVHDRISIIIVGISSVIIGIAVNYPLHLIAHTHHTPNIRSALKEIVMPLLVGNITTVGAFLALVPLKSVALRDLGLFSAFLLIGTIVFVLIYLPHLLKADRKRIENRWLDRIGDFSFENKRWLVVAVVALTVFFAYFSLQTTFDQNLRNINYLDDQQQADMAYFQQMMGDSSSLKPIYVVSSDTTLDRALDKNGKAEASLHNLQKDRMVDRFQGSHRFLCSEKEQSERLQMWEAFKERFGEALAGEVRKSAADEGFSDDAFNDFFSLLQRSYSPQKLDYFSILTSTAFTSSVCRGSDGEYNVIDVVWTDSASLQETSACIEQVCDGQVVFDVDGMNSSVANNLSDDFNYIGWACGLIVFFFLWFSMGHIELASLSFLPMALSWVWILGIMGLLGIHFNVVNVILATFIFGQGDDYTIFMTEGCQYEYAYRRKMLSSYKGSIIISALVMFIGIGSLIVAKHPALQSLAEVTIVGMFSVVLMAYLFPPLLFNWLVKKGGNYRLRPVTIMSVIRGLWYRLLVAIQWLATIAYRFLLLVCGLSKANRDKRVSAFVRRCLAFDMHHIPTVNVELCGAEKDGLENSVVQLKTLKSVFDVLFVTALGAKCVIVPADSPSMGWMFGQMIAMSGVEIVGEDACNQKDNVLKICISGSDLTFPDMSWQIHPGKVVLGYSELSSSSLFEGQDFESLKRLVLDCYRYKGIDIYAQARKSLSVSEEECKLVGQKDKNGILVIDGGWGALPLLVALTHSDCHVEAYVEDDDHLLVAEASAERLAPNLELKLLKFRKQ